MDYIELKRTLVAAFDHFLSCHDMRDLEEMMQALEAGKQLVIGFPEPIHREDYKDDALAREELNDDMAMMAKPAKKSMSHMRRKKPRPKIHPEQVQKHICDIPIFMDMSVLSSEKQKQFCKALDTDQHHITLQDIMIKGRHIFAMAKVSVPILSPQRAVKQSNWLGTDYEPVRAGKPNRMKEKKIIVFHDKKQFDPP